MQGGLSSFPTANNSFFEGAQATPSYGHNMATPNWQTSMPSREVRPSMYRRTLYIDLPPTTVLPKKHGDKTKNKVKNANVLTLNLGNAFANENVGGDDVMFLGEHDTGNYLVYENVDPSKVKREDYIDCMEFLLNPYDVYLDCHMMGYMVPDYFWRKLVPHLRMASRTLDGSTRPYPAWNDVDWVYMPINARGKHWVTGAVNLPDSLFYVFDSMHSEGTRCENTRNCGYD
ncbi:phospholipase-like protein [Tanacetum coccineum]